VIFEQKNFTKSTFFWLTPWTNDYYLILVAKEESIAVVQIEQLPLEGGYVVEEEKPLPTEFHGEPVPDEVSFYQGCKS
jgi:hypothetical protein